MDPHRRLPLVVLVASGVLGLVAGVVAVVLAVPRDETPRRAVVASEVSEPFGLRVLRAWDVKRSRAYERSDQAALAVLYVAGSRTGAADRDLLRSYRARGLRVSSMRTQLLSAQVLHESARRIALLVTDVLLDAVVGDGRGRSWALPHDRPSTRRVVLRLVGGRWRVVEAHPVG